MNVALDGAQLKNSLLVVDDSPIDRELICQLILDYQGYDRSSILTADSCEDALEIVEKHSLDCCLVDYRLPQKSGLDFIKALKKRKSGEYIPVVVMTGEGDEKLAVEIMRNGAQDYLKKNEISPEKLHHSISAAINSCHMQKQLHQLAYYDTLTGLLNRSLFMDRLHTTVNHCNRYDNTCSLFFIDVDDFKQVNDSYGHSTGDAILKTVAKRIKDNCRTTDSVARLGGDEFAVLLDCVKPEDAFHVAEKILQEAVEPVMVGGEMLEVSLSIGVAHYPSTSSSVEEFLKQADEAMYCAKKSGKANCFMFSEKHRQELDRKKALKAKLPLAIKHDELALAYQPIVSAADESVHSLEVLARWYPEGYTIGAQEMIDMIEEQNLFDAFNPWLIDTAFKQCAEWQSTYENTKFCINIPANHVHSAKLLQYLSRASRKYDIEPFRISLEITETTLMQDPALSTRLLTSLRHEGMDIAIDDFGTGYSSMAYLTTLPLNILKIDQSFVQNMVRDGRSRKVVEGITSLGHSLGLMVVAEGIETQQQHQMAKDIGCDLLQGFYFGRPQLATDSWLNFVNQFPHVKAN